MSSPSRRRKQVSIFLVNAAPQLIYACCISVFLRLKTGTLDYSLEVCKNNQEISITNWFIRGSALGPIGSLSARQFNGCLPCTEEKREEKRDIVNCLPDVISGILLKLSLATLTDTLVR